MCKSSSSIIIYSWNILSKHVALFVTRVKYLEDRRRMTDLLSDKTMEPRQEDDLVEDAAVYLVERKYPEGCSANRKRQIRKRAEKFVLNNGELYYQTKKNGQLHVGFLCISGLYYNNVCM